MLNTLTLSQVLAGLKDETFSLDELYGDLAAAAAEGQKKYNLFVTPPTATSEEAAESANLPLRGIPITVKDNFCTEDLRTTASSLVLDGFKPRFESTATRRLQASGGVVWGKTNLDAWAHGSSTETSDYGRTLNPRNPDHLPGGSSGGSAAALAADAAIAALGSETAGSIRQPSSWCGTVGLKPTYGRVSRYGVIAMASSTDSPGPMGKTVEDTTILLNHIAGHDPYDGTTSAQPVPDFTQFLNQDISGLKIGVMYLDVEGLEAVRAHYEKVITELEKLGAKVELVSALDPHYAIGVYTVIQRGEVSSNLARYDGIRYGKDRSHFGAEARRRIMLGTYTLSKGYADKYYVLAQKVRSLFKQDFDRLFSKYDVLIAPTTPSFAEKIGASESSALFGELADMLAEPSSITGLPGISVPCFRDPETNLFLGLNVMAPMWREDLTISVADAYEKATRWNTWRNHAQ